MKQAMHVRWNPKKIYFIIGLSFLLSGCRHNDSLDYFIQSISDDERTNSIILSTSIINSQSSNKMKINLHDETDKDSIKAEACKTADVENDLALYQSKLAEMKASYIDLLKSLSREEIDQPPLDNAETVMMLESKSEADIMNTIIFVLYDNHTFLINDGNNKVFYKINDTDTEAFINVYEHFFDYYLHENSPCWFQGWLPD